MPPLSLESAGLKSIFQPAADLTPNTPALLVILHGRRESARMWKHFLPKLEIPTLAALLVNAPTPVEGGGFSWYDPPPNQLPGILESRALLKSAFQEIHIQGYPPERCILIGFSQGCLMTLDFGSRYPHRLAGYIGISGYCHDPEALLRDASPEAKTGDWLITHGTRDEAVDVVRTRAQMQQLKTGGFLIDYREYEKTHTIQRPNELHDLRTWIQKRIESTPPT